MIKAKPPVPSSSKPMFAGSWKGTVENELIEIVLWSSQNNDSSFGGFAYAPKRDCLMYASVRKGVSLFSISFGYNSIITRENNCMLNPSDGPYSRNPFEVYGYATVNENSGVLNLKATKIYYLGKKTVDGEKNIEFKRTPISSKMLEIINSDNKENRTLGKPDAKLLSEMTKQHTDQPEQYAI